MARPSYRQNPLHRWIVRNPWALAVAAVLLAFLILESQAHCAEKTTLLNDAAPLFLAGAVDLGGTEWALAAPGGTVREANPFGQTLSRRVGLKAVTNAGGLLIVRRLRAGGKHGAAKWTKRGFVAAQVFAGGWAIHKGVQARRVK